MMMQVTTGVSSRESASPSTPPTDLVKPSLANSRTNCGSTDTRVLYASLTQHQATVDARADTHESHRQGSSAE